MQSDLNHVRVKDLNDLLLRDSTRNLDANVSWINLDNGVSHQLDHLVVEFDSIYTHNFPIPYTIEDATNYRLLIEGTDGGTAWADIYTPEFAEMTISPDVPVYSCSDPIEFTFEPVLSREPFITEGIINRGMNAMLTFKEEEEEEVDDKKWTFRYNSVEDLLQWIEKVVIGCPCTLTCSDLTDNVIHIAYQHYSSGYFGQTTLDTTSVTGGAGRFGAFYHDTVSFVVDTSETSSRPNF